MPKVLVLCQRRHGEGAEGVHEAIERLSHHLVGDGAEITYMSSNSNYKGERTLDGDTDIPFVFGHNKETDELARDYDLIINHQCPAAHMNYKRIHLHLKEGGHLAIASYDRHVVVTSQQLRSFSEKNGSYRMIQEAGFREADINPRFGVLLFQKVGDHTNYFKDLAYETSIFDPNDRTSGTEAERELYLENMRSKEKGVRAEVKRKTEEKRNAECAILYVDDDDGRLQCMQNRSFQLVAVNGQSLPADSAQLPVNGRFVHVTATKGWDADPLPVAHVTATDARVAHPVPASDGGRRKRTRKRKRKTRKSRILSR